MEVTAFIYLLVVTSAILLEEGECGDLRSSYHFTAIIRMVFSFPASAIKCGNHSSWGSAFRPVYSGKDKIVSAFKLC